MAIWTEWINRLRYLRQRTRIDDVVDDEVAFHLDMRASELETSGLSRRDARAQAAREFGSVALACEESRAAWQFRWFEDLVADLRYALRTFRRSPGFTLTAVLSLALGIGATSAIVTALDELLWRPLPVTDPQSLVTLAIQRTTGTGNTAVPGPLVQELRDARVFADVATRTSDGLSFEYDDRAERVVAEAVSPNYFTMLGVRPILGELFSAEVRRGEWAPEAVLGHAFWLRRFGGDPTVIGRTIRLNTVPFTIVGVSPPGFVGVIRGTDLDLRLPVMPPGRTVPEIALIGNAGTCASCMFSLWNAFARLAPGTTLAQAQSAADAQLQGFLRRYPGQGSRDTTPRRLVLEPGRQGWTDRTRVLRPTLYVLLVLAAMVLMIACVNVASLLMARATARARELAVRLSIGAGRLRLIRQMLAESLLLSLLGGIVGMGIAYWSGGLLAMFLPQGHISLVVDFHPDRRALIFTFALSVLTSVGFGLLPAFHATRAQLATVLKEGTAGSAGARHGARVRHMLVVAQVAFSVVLLIATGVFVRTLADLRPNDFTASPGRVLLFTIKPQVEIYTQERKLALAAELRRRLSETPGVAAVAFAENGPFGSRSSSDVFQIPGGGGLDADADAVTPGFFETVGIARVAGRDFTVHDKRGSPLVVIVNRSFARAMFGTDDVVGRSVRYAREADRRVFEIVGVVADARYYDVHAPARPGLWYAFQGDGTMYMPTLHVRAATADTASVYTAVRREFDRIDKGFPVFNIKTLGMRIDDSLARERMIANIASAFGVVALTLAAVGLYGILAYSVVRRRREIGIRIALGSSARAIVRRVAIEALRPVVIGSVAGGLLAIAGSKLLARYLTDVSPADGPVFAACAAAMLIVALIAACVPAWRACRVDPLTALRPE
jgi:predicted permease